MRGIPHVSRLALYYAGNALLPAKPLASPSATLHVVPSSVPLSGKKARRALGLVPSRIVDASLLHERLFVDEDDDGILSHLPSAPFYAALSSFSRSRLFPLSRSCERGVLLQSSGYAARFISYPTNWEARTAARIPERRFPPLRGMRYRERDDATGRNLRRANRNRRRGGTFCVPRRRRRFSITARRSIRRVFRLGQLTEIDSRLRIESYVIIFSTIQTQSDVM